METLFVSHNELRNLDKFLTFVQSKFAFLKELDLAGNPLAEEPDYRLKIIHSIPQIELLDRHIITPEERLKADKMFEVALSGSTKKHLMVSKKAHSNFSKGEKDLYKEVGKLNKQEEEKKA